MLEINLLPVREARRKADIRQQLMQLMLVLLLTLGAIGFWHSRVAEQISMSEVRVSQMQNDIKQFKPQLEQVAAFKIKKARLEKSVALALFNRGREPEAVPHFDRALEHLGVPATARASFGIYNDESDVAALVRGLERVKRIFG